MSWRREELLRAVISQAPGVVVLIEGADLRVTYASEAASTVLGREVLGQSMRELMAGAPALAIIDRVFATGKPEIIREAPLLVANAPRTRHYTRTYTPLRDDDGTVQAVLVQGEEVTAAVRAREARDLSEQRKRTEIDRMFALFDEAPVMLAVLTPPKWTLMLANRGLRDRLVNRVPIGVSLRDLLPPDSPALAIMDRVYETGNAETSEHTFQMPGFEDRSFSLSIVPLHSSDPTLEGVMVAGLEVTEHHRALQTLESQARELEHATRAKDQFLAMLGHELRNPLQPMLTAVQMMRLDGNASLALDMLEREVHYMTRLVGDLLDLSRVSRGMLTLEAESLDIRTAIARGLDLAAPMLEERQHRVTTDVGMQTLGVSGDPHRLAQIVSNLVQNAAKFSTPGSRIHIAARRTNDRIVLEISDAGVGIPPEMLERMFDAFVQGDQSLDRSTGGLGLGLAIVKHLVHAHEGTISARSEGLGRGSTFAVELPAVDLPPRSESRRSQPSLPARAPVRILVVDDNVESTAFLKMGLSRFAHDVLVAHDGPSALALAKLDRPQIALLDIGLPGMNGYELGERLRASHAIPIVAITGYGLAADRERSRAAGFAAHLVKPVDLLELVDLIGKLTEPATPA